MHLVYNIVKMLLNLAQTVQRLKLSIKYLSNKLTLKSAFCGFLAFNAFELSAKLTARRTNVRRRARWNVYKSTFHFVSRILHLNSFSITMTVEFSANNKKEFSGWKFLFLWWITPQKSSSKHHKSLRQNTANLFGSVTRCPLTVSYLAGCGLTYSGKSGLSRYSPENSNGTRSHAVCNPHKGTFALCLWVLLYNYSY